MKRFRLNKNKMENNYSEKRKEGTLTDANLSSD